VEGSLSLLLQCSRYEDMTKVSSGDDLKKNELLLDLLTPVAKTYPSEMGILSTSQSIQCFGGYGYCEDFPVEQHFRDMRIHAIHEGTTGIQGMDLLGRKVIMKDGKAVMLFLDEVQEAMNAADSSDLQPFAEQLREGLKDLQDVTVHLISLAQDKGPEYFLADATLYLEFFSLIVIAWQWLLQAVAAQDALKKKLTEAETNFYHGKLSAFRYFYSYELVKIKGLKACLKNPDAVTVDMKAEYFSEF
jgi:butyryl-CoA dehydrogenase